MECVLVLSLTSAIFGVTSRSASTTDGPYQASSLSYVSLRTSIILKTSSFASMLMILVGVLIRSFQKMASKRISPVSDFLQ